MSGRSLKAGGAEFTPLEADVCPECRKVRGGWYDERNRHMATEYSAGVEIWLIAKGYRLSNERVIEIVIHELGLMAYQAQSRVQRRNADEERKAEEE